MIFTPPVLTKYRLLFLKLRAIVGANRFMILNIVRNNQPINVTDITSISNLNQPIVSQLLSVLNKADFVYSTIKKKERIYTYHNNEIEKLIEFSHQFIENKSNNKKKLTDAYVDLNQTYQFLKQLLNQNRLTIIELLNKSEKLSVTELIELTNSPQSIISQNLKILRELKIVDFKSLGRIKEYYLIKENMIKYNKIVERYE